MKVMDQLYITYQVHNIIMSTISLTFIIANSNFIHNEGAKSVVYFDQLLQSSLHITEPIEMEELSS